ncbi:unnamed protein product [Prunus brigantina]
MHMFTIPMRKGRSLMIREKSVFFLRLVSTQKPINCTIPPPGRSSSVVMYYLMKKQYGTRQIKAQSSSSRRFL